jgi:hypothetical protein
MHGFFPSLIVTCGLDRTPNATVISKVYYVDATHVTMCINFSTRPIKTFGKPVRRDVYLEYRVTEMLDVGPPL